MSTFSLNSAHNSQLSNQNVKLINNAIGIKETQKKINSGRQLLPRLALGNVSNKVLIPTEEQNTQLPNVNDKVQSELATTEVETTNETLEEYPPVENMYIPPKDEYFFGMEDPEDDEIFANIQIADDLLPEVVIPQKYIQQLFPMGLDVTEGLEEEKIPEGFMDMFAAKYLEYED